MKDEIIKLEDEIVSLKARMDCMTVEHNALISGIDILIRKVDKNIKKSSTHRGVLTNKTTMIVNGLEDIAPDLFKTFKTKYSTFSPKK